MSAITVWGRIIYCPLRPAIHVNGGTISRVHQQYLGEVRSRIRRPSGNRPIWARNLDAIQKFYYRPKLVVVPAKGERVERRNRMMRRLSWDVTNSGRSRAHGILIGMRVRDAGYSTPLFRKSSLDPTHNIAIRFELTNVIDPPDFQIGGHRHSSL